LRPSSSFVVEGYMQAPMLNGSGMTQDRAVKRELWIRTAHSSRKSSVVRVASTRLPTTFGVFDLVGFERANVDKEETESALLLMHGDPTDAWRSDKSSAFVTHSFPVLHWRGARIPAM